MASRPVTPDSLGPDLVLHLDHLISRAEDAEGSPELGALAEEISIHYRALGICVLAQDADSESFFHWLVHSAITRRHYLRTVGAGEAGLPRYRRASFTDPVLDAMAARQWGLAQEICQLSSSAWQPDDEYEDDFCFAVLLRKLVGGERSSLAPVLQHWSKTLEGGSDPRLDLAEALTRRDTEEITRAVAGLVAHNERVAASRADPITGSALASDYPFFPNRWVSIDALAFLAWAERDGMQIDAEFQACPRIARAPMRTPFQPRAYPNQPLT